LILTFGLRAFLLLEIEFCTCAIAPPMGVQNRDQEKIMTLNLVQTVLGAVAAVAVLGSLLLMPGCGGSSSSEPVQPPASPQPLFSLVRLSTDPYANDTSQHATKVEPDTFAFGSTIVSAFQIGRRSSGGGSDIGFATSTDGGAT
jgi:hypothetical protein